MKPAPIILTLALMAAMAALTATPYEVPNPGPVLLVAIVYGTYVNGMRQGFAAALACTAFLAWSVGGFPWAEGPGESALFRSVVFLGAACAMVVLVGRLKNRTHALHEAERLRTASSARHALRQSKWRFQLLVHNVREVFWIIDSSMERARYVSPAFEHIWGRKPASHTDAWRTWIASIHPEDRERVIASRARMRRGEAVTQEYRIVRADGSIRWLRSHAFPVMGPDGRLRRIAGTGDDITERKLAEEERLAKAVEQRDALVREVHHRIKNNLQGVIGLLNETSRRRPDVADLMEPVIGQVRTIAIVHGLQGQAAGRTLACEMVSAIARSVETLTRARIAVRLDVPQEGICISEHHSVAVALILNELLFNAAKHSPEGGEIGVTVSEQPAGVAVRVVNPGRLPPHFDARVEQPGGAGLGLVRALTPKEGLVIRIEQVGDAVHTRVDMTRPVVAPPARPAEENRARMAVPA